MSWDRIVLWPLEAGGRLKAAVRRHWKRILAGAFVGWLFAVLGGAFALASLEFHGIVSRNVSDSLGIATVLCGIAFGGLVAYAARPREASSVPTRR